MVDEVTLTAVAYTSLLFAGLWLAYRWLLRPWFIIPFFVFGPLVLLLNIGRIHLQAFTWAKVLTLAATMLIILGRARVKARWQHGFSWAIVFLLALNILEAVIADSFRGNWLNAAIGLSLIATQRGSKRIFTLPIGERSVVHYDLRWSWILSYTVWNFTVVCAIYPKHWFDHIAILGAPLLMAALARDARRWLEIRAFILATYAFALVLVIEVGGFAWIPSVPLPAGMIGVIKIVGVAFAVWNIVTRLRRWGDAPSGKAEVVKMTGPIVRGSAASGFAEAKPESSGRPL